MTGGLRIQPPEPDLERLIARRIHGSRSGLDAEILDALVARPRRYMELQSAIKRNDKILNDALRRVVEEGLVHQRLDPSQGARARLYELSTLGVAVRDALVEYRLLDRIGAELRGPALEA